MNMSFRGEDMPDEQDVRAAGADLLRDLALLAGW
jgi:hypothetical protein